jgi:hypothetical protein
VTTLALLRRAGDAAVPALGADDGFVAPARGLEGAADDRTATPPRDVEPLRGLGDALDVRPIAGRLVARTLLRDRGLGRAPDGIASPAVVIAIVVVVVSAVVAAVIAILAVMIAIATAVMVAVTVVRSDRTDAPE